MELPKNHDVVRIVCAPDELRTFTGTRGFVRKPRIGDVGVVVHAYSTETLAVECVDSAGMTLWLADFHVGELEAIETDAESRACQIDLEMHFVPTERGGRETLPDLGLGLYRPHLRVPPSEEMLGICFVPAPYGEILHGAQFSATARPLYAIGVPYELLQPGAEFEVLEGAQIVARGSVIRRRQCPS